MLPILFPFVKLSNLLLIANDDKAELWQGQAQYPPSLTEN
jgi:hypothetical protein